MEQAIRRTIKEKKRNNRFHIPVGRKRGHSQFPFDVLRLVRTVLLECDVLHVFVVEQYVFRRLLDGHVELSVPRHRVLITDHEVIDDGCTVAIQTQFTGEVVDNGRRVVVFSPFAVATQLFCHDDNAREAAPTGVSSWHGEQRKKSNKYHGALCVSTHATYFGTRKKKPLRIKCKIN